MEKPIIEECYQRSIKLLQKNLCSYGIMAASRGHLAASRRYDYIFGRDAGICVLGMAASRDKKLAAGAKKSLLTLADRQTKYGQIPFAVQPAKKRDIFWYLGSIDSTLWWLIALDFYDRYAGANLREVMEKKVRRATRWLFSQDGNNCGLLEQGEACDWADNMPESGTVLYANTLWYKVLSVLKMEKEKNIARDGLNSLFFPHRAISSRAQYIRQEPHRLKLLNYARQTTANVPYYINFLGHKYASDRCDVYGNCLAIVFGIASPARAEAIIRYLRNQAVSKKYPVRVFFPPITEKDSDWRDYMAEENEPFHYHNGGIWPYIGAFYVMALHKTGHLDLAQKELARLAEANRENNWQFNEWFNGRTGEPAGMPGQSWNAGAFLLAYHYLRGEVQL